MFVFYSSIIGLPSNCLNKNLLTRFGFNANFHQLVEFTYSFKNQSVQGIFETWIDQKSYENNSQSVRSEPFYFYDYDDEFLGIVSQGSDAIEDYLENRLIAGNFDFSDATKGPKVKKPKKEKPAEEKEEEK